MTGQTLELGVAAHAAVTPRPLRRSAFVALAATAIVVVAAGEWLMFALEEQEGGPALIRVMVDGGVGSAYLAAGLIAWVVRPSSRTGALMYLTGLLFYAGNLSFTGIGVVVYPALGLADLWFVAMGVVIITYPTGRLTGRAERGLALAATIWVVVASFVNAMLLDLSGCVTCWPNPWTRDVGPVAADAWNLVSMVMGPLLWICFAWLVIRRWAHASPVARRWLTPVWLSGIVLAVIRLGGIVVESVAGQMTGFVYSWTIADPLSVVVPIALAWGLVRARLSQGSVGDLVVELDRRGMTDGWRESIGRALGDPEVVLAIGGSAAATGLSDPEGRRSGLEAEGRAVTPLLELDGSTAYLVHDASLAANPGLVRAVAAATRLALDNQRLAREVESQLAEVRASRARIVEASDAERARVERNLHDGAQQRLVTLALRMRAMAGAATADGATAEAATFDGLATELDRALDELRELARGIHPAAVVEGGLAAAVEGLAERTSVPVGVDIPGTRWPVGIEVAAWFVVSEAVTNAVRHAAAHRIEVRGWTAGDLLHVDVVDDGQGGADPARGTGLGGLADRVAALGGTLEVTSPIDVGTTVRATFPLGDR